MLISAALILLIIHNHMSSFVTI